MEKKLKCWFETLGDKEKPDEFDAKQLVKLYSIKVPKGKRLGPKDELNIDDIKPPYVLKVCSSNILHKTELKGVLLNNDKECIQDNFKLMRARFPKENILVENQSTYRGPEFIIGIIKDPALGHAVMVGAGGVLTEIYKDTAFRLAPCSVNDAMDMIDELVLSPVFDDFRGISLDKRKLAQTISQVSTLADDLGDKLSQLDINPIVFSDGEWIALDVKVMFAEK
ncbi:MAG: acetate--CoA ligase family protein [Desulfobacula sp.]|uniref:acetate--CoA ligase family protein n=1 Tax=Desulfobacula sp. TaxID=2593537 RepID=UPI0025C346ED|nr:acetate--CoA ligase family protein [Desulfobacula sp.]MCD4719976.1 acetate--CoA ligase family protein [Desulfobacula sp.]